jgi:hypothetical protein
MALPDAIRARLDGLAASAQPAAEALDGAALDGAALDLAKDTLAEIAGDLDMLAGRLDLLLDRLGAAVDPARCER